MKEPQRRVQFYRRALLEGCVHNMRATPGLRLTAADPLRPCAYVTAAFDTREEAGTFHRLVVEGAFEEVKLEVIVAAADLPDPHVRERLACPEVPAREKARLLCSMRHVRAAAAPDLLLHSLTGRYVWIYVGMSPAGGRACVLEGLRLEFPRESFTDYLPEIYRGNDFLDRYVGVFQSLYLDLERRVDELPRLLDEQSACGERLAELASWLGVDNEDGLFDETRLRRYLGRLDLFQGKKGTRRALEAVVELCCEVRPRVIERVQWELPGAPAHRRELYERLYGGPRCVCLLLDGEAARPVEEGALDRLIEKYLPIGVPHLLVRLGRCSQLDEHCYLDINSVFVTPRGAELDAGELDACLTLG